MNDTRTEAHTIGATARHTVIGLAGVALALLCLAAAIVFYAISNRHEVFAPLGPYPEQSVLLPVERGHPTLHLDNDPLAVPVTGRKCVTGSGYTISGVQSWQSVDPPGTIIRTGTGVREAVDGCTTIEFVNLVPRSVESAMRSQLRAGLHRPLWRIVGLETPERDGVEGTSVTWATEPFAVAG